MGVFRLLDTPCTGSLSKHEKNVLLFMQSDSHWLTSHKGNQLLILCRTGLFFTIALKTLYYYPSLLFFIVALISTFQYIFVYIIELKEAKFGTRRDTIISTIILSVTVPINFLEKLDYHSAAELQHPVILHISG